MVKRILDILFYCVLSIGLMTTFVVLTYYFAPIYFGAILPFLMFTPLISVLVVNKLFVKRSLSDFGLMVGDFSIILLVLSIVFPFIVIGLALPFAFVFGVYVDFSFSGFYSYLRAISSDVGIPYDVLLILFAVNAVVAPLFNMIFGFGEEFGWRGYLLTRLEEEFGRVKAIIFSGVVWGVWHWPLILLVGYNYTYETRFLGAVIFTIYTIILGVFLSWLRFKTSSVLLPSIAHGSFNAYIGFGVFLYVTDPIIGFPVGLLSLVGVSLLIGLLFVLDKEIFNYM